VGQGTGLLSQPKATSPPEISLPKKDETRPLFYDFIKMSTHKRTHGIWRNGTVIPQYLRKEVMEERKLIQGIARKEASALQCAIDRFGGYVHAVVRRTVRGIGTAEDFEELSCDVFVILWSNASRLAKDSNLKAWLAVVARNRALRWARRQHLDLSISDVDMASYEFEADLIADWETRQELRGALLLLGDTDRTLIERYYFEDQGIARIAQDIGLSNAAVKSRLHRARQQLKEVLMKGVPHDHTRS
jgi:RNA polymerase sigma-70 factor (ECF subfamily)